ncbi:MAG: dipicolinate synthase subunit B [Christensenellales bacterium]
MNIGIAITGSFCTCENILAQLEKMVKLGHNIIPIISKTVATTDTRFGTAKEFVEKIEKICGKSAVKTIVEAEPLGPQNKIDVLAIAPCTGNTLAKIANGLSDDAVTMASKAHMRNYKPLVVAISTNDGLGLNMQNIAKLMNEKKVFFVPFRQDSPTKKPKSLVADLDLLLDTILLAKDGEQIQPVLI